VDFLLKKNKVDVLSGTAQLIDKNTVAVSDGEGKELKRLSAFAIILAAGSRPRQIPGFEFDEQAVLSSTGILMLKELPPAAHHSGGRSHRHGIRLYHEQLWCPG